MNRYILVVHLPEDCTKPPDKTRYDTIRYDTVNKEFVYGDDFSYSKESKQYSFGVNGLNILDLSDEDFDELNDKLISITGEDVDALTDCGTYFVKSKLTQEQLDIIQEYTNRVNDKKLEKIYDRYNNNFSIENPIIREENKKDYEVGLTPTDTAYCDENGLLYRVKCDIGSTSRELIYDSRKPLEIDKELVVD